MITADQFIKTHRDTACRADWLASLAQAANLVLEGGALADKDKRRAIAQDVLGALQFLSEDLSAKTEELSNRAECDGWNEKKGGAA